MTAPLRVALISHDARKQDMREWAEWNRAFLSRTRIWATHHTGELVVQATGLQPHMLKSGPLGGDAQVAAMIADAELEIGRASCKERVESSGVAVTLQTKTRRGVE